MLREYWLDSHPKNKTSIAYTVITDSYKSSRTVLRFDLRSKPSKNRMECDRDNANERTNETNDGSNNQFSNISIEMAI